MFSTKSYFEIFKTDTEIRGGQVKNHLEGDVKSAVKLQKLAPTERVGED